MVLVLIASALLHIAVPGANAAGIDQPLSITGIRFLVSVNTTDPPGYVILFVNVILMHISIAGHTPYILIICLSEQ